MAKILRLLVATVIVLFPIILGWHHRSPLLIPIIGALYVPLYFLGKAEAWALFEYAPSRAQLLKTFPITYIVQSVLVGLFYLIGVGLGTLFAGRSIHWPLETSDFIWVAAFLLLTLPITFLIAVLDHPKRRSKRSKNQSEGSSPNLDDSDDFYALPYAITPETFYRGEHFSRRNYTRTALTDVVDFKGEKPIRAPKCASEAMISETEKQLGLKFPDTLRTLYKIQNGGSLPTYYVPKYAGAKNIYEDWITAFATDYDDLKPLENLQTLHSLYMEGYDPDYNAADIKDDWISGSEKLIVLTIRTGYGTALDYRGGDVPGVLLFNVNEEKPELKRFDTFDSFLGACREIRYDDEPEDSPHDVAFGTPPNPIDADRFWESGNAGPGVTQPDWESASQHLGVALPHELFPFFAAANGGKAKYKVALQKNNNDKSDPLHVFPTGPYVHAGNFLKLEHWVSLATLSDRLNFIDGYSPWRDLYDAPEKLIIISAAFDSAIMLDYRENAEAPRVIAISNLDTPDSAHIFPSVTNFLSRLRKYGRPEIEAKNDIGDDSISARLSNSESFWVEDPAREPVNPQTLQGFLAKWDLTTFGLPTAITQLYEKQNGGQIRFRFAPPQTRNAHGYMQRLLSSNNWINVFPNGWRPLEDWQDFSEWRQEHRLAMTQSLLEFTDRINAVSEDDENITLRLFIIGADKSEKTPTLTLLDMSQDYFNRNRHILTVRFDVEEDQFNIIFGPIMSDNIYAGLHQVVRARKAEL